MKKQKALSFGEILIIVVIVGLLVFLTMPGMKSNRKNSTFRKAYTTLNDAYSEYFTDGKQRPADSSVKNTNNLFLALTEKLKVNLYYSLNDSTGAISKTHTAPIQANSKAEIFNSPQYTDLWIKTKGGIAYQVAKPTNENTPCKSKYKISAMGTLEIAQAATIGTCMWVTVDYNAEKAPNVHCATGAGITEKANTIITDAKMKDLAKCDRITLLLSSEGFTPGNLNSTVAGKLIGKD